MLLGRPHALKHSDLQQQQQRLHVKRPPGVVVRAGASRFPPPLPNLPAPHRSSSSSSQGMWRNTAIITGRQGRGHRLLPCTAAAVADAPGVAHPQPSAAAALRLALETLRPDWPLLAVTTVALVGTIFFTLLFPLVIGEVFNLVSSGSGSGAAAAVNPLAGLAPTLGRAPPSSFTAVMAKLGACLVLSATGNAVVSWCSALVGERFGHRLRNRLMETLMVRDQAFFDATSKGDLVSRLTLDVVVLQTTLADFIGQRGFRSMFEVVGALIMVALQQPLLAVVTLAVTPALSRVLRSIVVRSSGIMYQRQQVAAEALDFASERLSQVQTVQVFAQEEREAGAFSELSARGYAMAQRYAFFQGIVEGAGRLATNVGTVALLGLGGMLVIQNRISVGALLAVNVYNLFISVGLGSVAASLGELGKAVGALERIAELVVPTPSAADSATTAASSRSSSSDAEPSTSSHSSNGSSYGHGMVGTHAMETPASSSTNGSSAQVQFQNVSFKYPGVQDWAVKNLNLTLQQGQTVALVGPSGGGKSTIAALLLGLYHPQQGSILVSGVPLDRQVKENSSVAAVGMAAVLQQPMLMSGSVREQISYGKPDASMEEVLEAARAAHADEFVRQLPQGYETEVGERGHALSGGQKQRLAIARALLLHPKILVLDEITSALDVTSERYISDTLRSSSATKLIIAHRLSTVRRADVIAVVVDGTIVEQGSHRELIRLEGGIYQRLVNTSDLGSFWAHAGVSDSGSDEEVGRKHSQPDAAGTAVHA